MIWTKFELVDDPETGELTKEARDEIERYVDVMFVRKCGRENVSRLPTYSVSSCFCSGKREVRMKRKITDVSQFRK